MAIENILLLLFGFGDFIPVMKSWTERLAAEAAALTLQTLRSVGVE
jgi:hypothetical protein